MNASAGRGRASLLQRSVSAELPTPGGLHHSLSSSSVVSADGPSSKPAKRIKPKRMTFQKPRPLKGKTISPNLIEDINNSSISRTYYGRSSNPLYVLCITAACVMHIEDNLKLIYKE